MHQIYETSGRAREYNSLALNIYRGCTHGCKYCYAPGIMFTDRQAFHNTATFRLNWDLLEKDAASLKAQKNNRPILLCFTTDPYQPIDAIMRTTREVIKVLKKYHQRVTILTKGGLLSTRDLDLLGPSDSYGTTLTLIKALEEWEPKAASYTDRVTALKIAKQAGIPTWVSLEPVISPADTYQIIKDTHGIVGHYKVGKMNYHPLAREIDWNVFGHLALKLLQDVKARYYFKQDLLKEMVDVEPGNFNQTWECE